MADWREAKPLLDGIRAMEKQRPGSGSKIRLGVLALSNKIHHRATEWAANEGASGLKIKVVADSSLAVEAFIRECVVAMDIHGTAPSIRGTCEGSDAHAFDVRRPLREPVLECLARALKHPDKVLCFQL
mmetsp:Transcript_48133/g.112430  ORF Transcript_48133/g.112430 Transcript_48133/m.112430 type:complete len:129 (+) Transcript_48133:3-389(+)